MHIPRQLPQFTGRTALIVVMGTQRGLVYLATDGRIDIVGTVEQPQARYTDREGFFMNAGNGMIFGSGAVYEDHNIERIRRFYKQVAREVHRMVRTYDIDHTFVFEPPYAKGAVTQALRRVLHDRIELVRYGNYLHAPATVLLQYIARAHEPEHDPADPASVQDTRTARSEERRKILTHAAQARDVIRG